MSDSDKSSSSNTENYKGAYFEFTNSNSQCDIKIIYTPETAGISFVDSGQRTQPYDEEPGIIKPNIRISQSFPTQEEASAYGKGVVDSYDVKIENYDTALSNLSKLGTLSSEEKVAYKQGWESQQVANTP